MSNLGIQKNDVYLQSVRQGLMAERLGTALQKLLQRFESASDLTKTALQYAARRFSFYFVIHLSYDCADWLNYLCCPAKIVLVYLSILHICSMQWRFCSKFG